MKTIIGLVIFDIFAIFAIMFYYEAKKVDATPYKAEITHIERLNDSISCKLLEDSLRFEKALQQSKNILKQSNNIQNEK